MLEVLFATFCIALQGIFIKLSILNGSNILFLLLSRNIVFIIVIYFIARGKDLLRIDRKNIIISFIAGFCSFYFASFASIKAISLIPVGIERLIFFAFPVFVIIINSVITRQIPSKIIIFLVFLSQIGIALTVINKNTLNINGLNIGYIWAIAESISIAIYIVINGKLLKTISSMQFVFFASVSALIFIIMHYLLNLHYLNLNNLIQKGVFYTLCYCIISLMGMYFLSQGIKKIGSIKSSIINSAGPVIALAMGFIIFGETVSIIQISGMILILSSVVLIKLK